MNLKTLFKQTEGKKWGRDQWLILILVGILILIIAWPTGSSDKRQSDVSEGSIQGGGLTAGGNITGGTTGNDGLASGLESDELTSNLGNGGTYTKQLESQLTELIASIDGAGRAKVMITMEDTGETIVLKEQNYSRNNTVEEDSAGGSRNINQMEQTQETVSVQDESGNTVPFVLSAKYPKVEGVVVICEGAGKTTVSTQIVKAVQALFGIDAHKVVVIKMKSEL